MTLATRARPGLVVWESLMNCPACGEPLPARTCPACGGQTLVEARYCHLCGEPMPAEETHPSQGQRIACSDGTCIGIIGPDGRCTICGKPYTGPPLED